MWDSPTETATAPLGAMTAVAAVAQNAELAHGVAWVVATTTGSDGWDAICCSQVADVARWTWSHRSGRPIGNTWPLNRSVATSLTTESCMRVPEYTTWCQSGALERPSGASHCRSGGGCVVSRAWPAPRPGRMFVLDDRSTRGAHGDPRPTLHHRARSRGGRHGHRVCRARSEARPPRRAQGAETRARRAARRRAIPERNPGHRTPAAPAHPAALRLGPSRRPHLLRDAARGGRIAAPAAGTGEAAAVGDGDRDHSRGRECPRLRPPPRRDPPRYQTREHPVPGRTGGRRRFRDRARAERSGGLAPDGDGVVPRHAAVHEPRAGHRRPSARRAQRHLLARLRPLRDARGRATPHRPHRAVGDRQGPDGPGSPIALAPDGSRIVYAGTDSLGTRWLFSRGFARVEPALIPGTAGAGQPFFSPDGQSIGFWQDGRLRKLSLSGGAVVTICEVPSVEGATWGVGDEIVFAASGPLYRVSAAGGKPEVFAAPDTAGGQAYRWPEFLPDGRTVLLTLVDGSGPHLAVLQGGRVRALGQTGMSPHYVDGGFILFAQTDGTLFAAPFDPRRGRFTGPPGPVVEGVRIGQLAVAKLGASRTGSLVFITGSTAPRELVMVDRAGHAQTLPAPLERYRAPRFSPDGRRIAVAIEHGAGGIFSADIWVYELGARNLSRLTFDSVNMFPEWARDGRQVAFVRQLGAITREGLFRIAADGSGVAETLLVRPYPVWEVQFTPDGRTMLFRENHPQTHRDIWITPVDSPRAARPLLRTPFEERGIGLSPDGRWLVYVSNETGADEIYIRQLREGSARWRVSTRGGTEARWGRVGRELFFRKGDTVYAVTTQLGAEVRLGAPRALFTGKYQAAVLGQSGQNVLYDVSPDGGRFLIVREQNSGNGEQLTVVLNWFDQVRRRGTAAAP